MKNLLLLFGLATAFSVHADFSLAGNGRTVNCVDDKFAAVELNAARTTMKIKLNGRVLGTERITQVHTDNASYVAYDSKSGSLTLSDQVDFFTFMPANFASFLDCR